MKADNVSTFKARDARRIREAIIIVFNGIWL
jgi:hypothetical protein